MKGTLILESGEKVSVDYDEKDFLVNKKRLTGMEKIRKKGIYYYISGEGTSCESCNLESNTDKRRYETANYYSDKGLCDVDSRADTLMRKIRKYAREHNDFKTTNDVPVCIFYNFHYGLGISNYESYMTTFHNFIFTESTALEIIDKYGKDLLWYFEEYLQRYSGYYDNYNKNLKYLKE